MKSVDEETNKNEDGDDYSDDNDAMEIDLQDINDITTPKDHEQNEQSFRGGDKIEPQKQPTPKQATAPAAANVNEQEEEDEEDDYEED